MMKKMILLLAMIGSFGLPKVCGAQVTAIQKDSAVVIHGTVFSDDNRNGRRDIAEAGIPGVLISNGKQFVQTGAGGAYVIEVSPDQLVFPVVPAGYSLSTETTWWYDVRGGEGAGERAFGHESQLVDFPLNEEGSAGEFTVLAVGDVQIGDRRELDYAGRTLFPELINRRDYDFSIFMGDLVNDEPVLMEPLKTMMSQLRRPFRTVYGNHDRTFEQEPQARAYNRHFGPENYAFFRQDVLFVSLNSIYPKGTYGYEGVYSETELEFIDAVIEQVSSDQLVVISQHIPLRWMKNRQALVELLEEQEKVLVLSAHSHTVFQEFYDTRSGRIHEVNVGATSGHWWTGQKDWQGNPLALMKDGTPRGYFEITFSGRDYKLSYKGVGLPEQAQMSLWFGQNRREVTREIDTEHRQVFVNVYAGSEETQVRMRIDQDRWQELHRVNEPDPFIERIKWLQDEELYPNALSRRSPYRRSSSRHLWKGEIPREAKPGMHKLEVSARDTFGLKASETTWFWVK